MSERDVIIRVMKRLSVQLKFKVGNDLLFAAHYPGQDDGIACDCGAKRFFCHV